MNLLDMILDLILGLISNFTDSLIEMFVSAYNFLNAQGSNVLNIPIIKDGVSYVQGLAFYILIIKLIFEGYQIYMLRQSGDPDSSPAQFVLRGIQSIAIITVLPWLVNTIYEFGALVATDALTVSGGSSVGDIVIQYKGLGGALADTGLSIINIIMIVFIFLICLILLLVVAIQVSLRTAELAILTIIGPIMALNITTTNRSIWNQWFKHVFGLCLTHALQMFMLVVSLKLLSTLGLSGGGNTFLLFIGWLWITLKTPNFIKQFTHQTGAGSVVGGAFKQYMSMRTMRSFLRR